MAKENVTFIERHVEKIAIGVTGAILLATAAFYMPYINTPNKVELNSELYSPKAFYKQMKDDADSLRARMKNAQPDDQITDLLPEITKIDFQLSPYTANNLPPQITKIFVTPNPKIPDIVDIIRKSSGKIILADVLPPTKLQLTTGRALARYNPEPQTINVGTETKKNDEKLDSTLDDCHWVTITAILDRKKQREIFANNKYADNLRELAVANIELERQEVLPDGTFGQIESVQPYRPIIELVRTQVPVKEQNDIITVQDDIKMEINKYRENLETRKAQDEILRPVFQDYLEDDPLAWTHEMEKIIKIDDELEIDLEEEKYGLLFPPDGEERRADKSSGSGSGTDLAAQKQAKEDLGNAIKA
ncbi:MAG: hypothetical protein ACYTF1_03575, partial [Planctomycetota bacterium]